MQYMLMFYETAEQFARRGDPGAADYWAGWMAYVKAVADSGIKRAGAGLQPPATATSLRLRGSKRQIQDGPFADSKEQLGGFFLIEVDNLDAALEWAARAPCAATGGVEVRPVLPPYKAE
jgi:hypothetical protein